MSLQRLPIEPETLVGKLEMHRLPQQLLVALFVIIQCFQTLAEPIPFAAGTHVVVTTNDGRTHQGQLGSKSETGHWELLDQDGGIRSTIVIPIANIVHVAAVNSLTSDFHVRQTDYTDEREVLSGETTNVEGRFRPTTTSDSIRPQWIETTARLLNTDNAPHPDSLEIRVVGLSRDGHNVRLDGSIDARLIGLHQRHSSRAPRLTQLERWNPKIAQKHRQGHEVVFVLPLRNRRTCDPSFSWAKLKVRLNTPGQGSWDAETSVFLQNLDPFEEQWLIQLHRWSLGSPSLPVGDDN